MLIFQAIEFVRLNLNAYINSLSKSDNSKDNVKLGNVSLLADPQANNGDFSDGVYLSLVNIQEEVTFKNKPPVRVSDIDSNLKEPPLYLNLFILVSSFFRNYNKSLEFLSYVVLYFHDNKKFTYSIRPVSENVANLNYTFNDSLKNSLQLTFDLYSLTFEQLNYLWGTLGGRQFPFVLYKVRVLEIESTLQKKGSGYIEEIKTINPIV